MADNSSIVETLIQKGVIIPAPDAVVLDGIDPSRIEPGVVLHPGVTLVGGRTYLGKGSELGFAGGGRFENVVVGQDVKLYGGLFVDCVFFDGVTVRGHAEIRGGTIMEEGAEAAHHVGLKLTIVFPNVVFGSLVNFCDALIAGGTSRKDHSEVGSALALYNFTPWGDKFASIFGDVCEGVFLNSTRIFVGGQTQIVSPVSVGYGALIPAGCAVRRDVAAGRMYGESAQSFDAEFDPTMYGRIERKFSKTIAYIAELCALRLWYATTRTEWAAKVPHRLALVEAGLAAIEKSIQERIKRLDKVVDKLPISIEKRLSRGGDKDKVYAAEQTQTLQRYLVMRPQLETLSERTVADVQPLLHVGQMLSGHPGYRDAVKALTPDQVAQARLVLEAQRNLVSCLYPAPILRARP